MTASSQQIKGNNLQLTWLGTAGFKIDTSEGAVILIDPFLSRPATATPTLPLSLTGLSPVDEILLTNGRFDHAMDTPALVKQTGAIVHAPGSICGRLADLGVPLNSLESVSLRKIKYVGSLGWQALAAQMNQADSSPALRALNQGQEDLAWVNELERQWPSGETVAYHLQADDISMIHFGCSGWVETEPDDLHPDLILLPVERHPRSDGNTLRLISLLKPKVVIPHHWDNYYPPLSEAVDLSEFITLICRQTPSVTVYQPVIGESFDPANLL
ncbi:MAG: MBL fold metallo-hydrolase [Anaerolineae bacterium]|nr:MBL fold metallo-hydrolase [Anaerolineae bacterium]